MVFRSEEILFINYISQSKKSELLRTLLLPSVVNGFSWVKIRLKLSLFRNIFIKTKSFSLTLLCTLLTAHYPAGTENVLYWLLAVVSWEVLSHHIKLFSPRKISLTMRRLLSITKLCLDLVFCLQSLLSSNKWPRPRYVRNYSSHIKVVSSLGKNIYHQNIDNVRSTPTHLSF